ncbi:MAG: hypothetical protein OYH77_05335 [Pseudomonadota bacterium]|nr:hypothetical protein [Pseudomonadota bacterium]
MILGFLALNFCKFLAQTVEHATGTGGLGLQHLPAPYQNVHVPYAAGVISPKRINSHCI